MILNLLIHKRFTLTTQGLYRLESIS